MRIRLFAALCLLSLSTASWATTGPTGMQDRFNAFDALIRTSLELPEQERTPAITRRFDALFDGYFAGTALQSLPDADLELLFRATDDASYFPSGPKYTDLLARAYGELVRRNQATGRHHAALYGELIQARRFRQARALYRAHPEGLEPLPSLAAEPIDGPSVWGVDAAAKRLTRRAVDFGQADIVVLVHPLCHFSRNALADVMADPVLRDMLARHATLVVPPERGFRIDLVGAWNAEHPAFPMTFMYARADWPMFSAWGTPTFYFFRDGKLAQTVEGWPKEGRKDALIEAGMRVGLLGRP